MIKKIKKRNGDIVDYDKHKIQQVMWKAVQAVGGQDAEGTNKLTVEVEQLLEKAYGDKKVPTVEDVQDMVEKVLIEEGHSQTAKAFILYRKKRQELREAKSALGIEDDMKLSFDALRVLTQHHLLRQKDGKQETPRQMFERVARTLSKAEKKYGGDQEKMEQEFIAIMTNLELIPSTTILRNSGSPQHLCEGFVLPLEDDITSLFDTLKQAALLHKNRQRGFGIGMSFSALRAKGSKVGTNGLSERAGGPVSFLLMYDRTLHEINPHGTNMAFLSVHHPDIIDFVTAKESSRLRSFGTSVLLTREFMRAADEDKMYKLVDPHTGQAVSSLRAKSVLDMIATIAWRTGDPAVVFLDNLNKAPANPFMEGLITATTPTGEHPLFPHEGCFTASINMVNHANENEIDWEKLRRTVQLGVQLLDNAIDVSQYPSVRMKNAIERTRRIGLGITGWADLLIRLGLPYNSDQARELAEKVMKFVSGEAKSASIQLARKRGVFEDWKNSVYAKKDEKVRNSSRTTIVHGGIVSMIAGCSSGIEPYYAISYMKRTPTAQTIEVIPAFEDVSRREGFYSADLMKTIALAGSVKKVKEVPAEWRKIFMTSHDCLIDDHLAVQVAFQKHTDNGVSKTINLPATATINEVENVIIQAYGQGCRSVHIYREGSSMNQLMHSRSQKKKRVKVRV